MGDKACFFQVAPFPALSQVFAALNLRFFDFILKKLVTKYFLERKGVFFQIVPFTGKIKFFATGTSSFYSSDTRKLFTIWLAPGGPKALIWTCKRPLRKIYNKSYARDETKPGLPRPVGTVPAAGFDVSSSSAAAAFPRPVATAAPAASSDASSSSAAAARPVPAVTKASPKKVKAKQGRTPSPEPLEEELRGIFLGSRSATTSGCR